MNYWLHWHNIKYELSKRRERLLIWFVWRLPRGVAYWSTIRTGVHATQGEYSNQIVPDLLFMDVLKRWESL